MAKSADTDTLVNVPLLDRIDSLKNHLDSKRPLPPDVVMDLRRQMRLAHAYNSNAIEGNTLTMRETDLVISEGLTVGGKSLTEHLEARGTAAAFDLVEDLAEEGGRVDHVVIQLVHELLMRGIMVDVGKYRTVNVRITGASITPPDYAKVVKAMDDLFDWLNTSSLHPVVTAAEFHHRLARIHPFVDGNGRICRLLHNLLLIRQGYPPITLKKQDRMKYYACLEKANGGNIKPFADFTARAVLESLMIYNGIFGGDDDLVPLAVLAQTMPHSQEYLSLRARQGKLSAVKIDNVWHTSRRAIQDYQRNHGREVSS